MALTIQDTSYIRHKVGDHDVVYQLSDEDRSGTTHYFGYVNDEGGWILQSYDTTTGALRYVARNGDAVEYAFGWQHRKDGTYTYGLYNTIFDA